MLKIIPVKAMIMNKLFLIVLIGLLLRLIGTNYGYPYIFNIDEPTIIRSALGLRHTSEINHFDWPHFTVYFNYAFYFIFIKLRGLVQVIGLREFLESIFPILWNDPFVFYFITRFLNATFGALTIIPIYMTARDMFSRRVGFIGAAMAAVLPYHVYISHVATPDSLLLFFVAWAVYFSYKFSRSFKWVDITLAAVMYGIASGVKYQAIVMSTSLIVFVWYRLKNSDRFNLRSVKEVLPKFVVFGIVSLITLLATTPGIITDWDLFWSYEYGKGFLWQLTENSGPLGLDKYFPALWEQLVKIFRDTGFVVFPLFIYGIFRASQKDTSTNERNLVYISAAIAVAFILFTSRYSRATSHYFLPMYSLLITVAAWGISKFKNRVLLYPVLALLFGLSCMVTVLFIKDDTRRIALNYYEKAKEAGGRIYFEGNDLSETDMINNLGMKRAKNGYELGGNDLLLTQTPEGNNDKIVVVETIGNYLRNGPTIYVYKKAL